jgi:hypothetical protein
MAAQQAAAAEVRRSFLFMRQGFPGHVSGGGEFAKRSLGVGEEADKHRRRRGHREL